MSRLSSIYSPALLLVILLLVAPHTRAGNLNTDATGDDQSLTGSIRIADLIDYAYAHNPSIQQAREAWWVTVENYRLTTGYPDPQLMVTWFPEPIETRLGPQDWNAQISQMIPFPGKLSKAGELVAADARIARMKLDKVVKGTMLAVQESYYELWYIRQARRVTPSVGPPYSRAPTCALGAPTTSNANATTVTVQTGRT